MTIIVVVPSADGTVVAADSWACDDGVVHLRARKILVGPDWVVAAHGQLSHQGVHLLHHVDQILAGAPADVPSIVQLLTPLMAAAPGPAGLVVAGWDAGVPATVKMSSNGAPTSASPLFWAGATWPLDQLLNGRDLGAPPATVQTALKLRSALPLPHAARLATGLVEFAGWATEFTEERIDVVPGAAYTSIGSRAVDPCIGGAVQVAVLSEGAARWWS